MIALLTLLAPPAVASDGMPPRTHHVRHRDVVTVETRDGTELHTVVFVPKGDAGETFPTVVTRVPYYMDPVLDWQCRMLARRGFACVYQHVRGRGRSEGEWSPFVHEERDGQDLIAWIGDQGWSDGKVAWLGDSYLAATGWTVALEDPDGLTTLVSRIFAPSLYNSAYEDGLLRHELVTAWMTIMPDEENHYVGIGRRYHRALDHRPRTTMDEVAARQEVEWFRGWLTAEDPVDPTWNTGDPGRFRTAPANTTIPVLMVGGWSDAFVEAQVDAWETLASRDESLLVIGPWAHLGQKPAAIPLRNVDGTMLQLERVADWLDTHLQGEPARFPQQGAITYVVGGDRWETRPSWPPPTIDRTWAVVAGSDACDGGLAEGAAPLATPLAYAYDPEDPLPSRGGAGMLAGAVPTMNGVKPGFVRANEKCRKRDDVLRFTSEPLPSDLHLAGRIRVEMEVASDAPDTAFGFRLLERRPGGKEFVLREGFTTLALRDGGPRQPYTPGERVRVVADAAPLEAELHEGSSLVLVLTSSSFPSYEAHPNVDGLISAATETRVANQQITAATLVIPEVAR